MGTGSGQRSLYPETDFKSHCAPTVVSFSLDAIVHISCAELNKDRNQTLALKKEGKYHIWFSHKAMIPLPFLAGSQSSSVRALLVF